MIKILVVDDHPIFRHGLIGALADLDGLEVCGEAAMPGEALGVARDTTPDVVLMDLDLGGESGIDVTAALIAEQPKVAVLMLTMHDDEALVFAAVCAGARGYVLKGVDQAELERTIRSAADGNAVFGAGVARKVLARLSGPSTSAAAPAPPELTRLTERERQILDLMAEGWGNQTIAQRLFLSPKTVRNNVSTVLGKLQVSSRGEAIVQARGWGMGAGGST